MDARRAVSEIFHAAVKAVDPYESVKSRVDSVVSAYHRGRHDRLVLVGIGKAAGPMTQGFMDCAGDIVSEGIVITKYGHAEGMSLPAKARVFEAGHPVPDMHGLAATVDAVKMLSGADEKTMAVCLISGGASSLFVAPFGPITLEEKQEMTGLLLKAGADINEINSLRKHISAVKGGRLAEIVYPGRTISLILSDVIGDKLDVIASGPTAPDNTGYGDAYNVVLKYDLENTMPPVVLDVLKKGMEGRVPETPKPGSSVFERVENILVGSNRMATRAAKEKAESLGFEAVVFSNEVQGEAREVAAGLADKAYRVRGRLGTGDKAVCVISGGETTVKVTGGGQGGRNMELALAFADAVAAVDGITLLSAGTDGTDGPTDAAGAIVDGSTIVEAEARGVDPIEHLLNNDSYNFFKAIDGLFITGPTGTNVMDLQIILISPPGQ